MLSADFSETMRSEVDRILKEITKLGNKQNAYSITMTLTSSLDPDLNMILSKEIKELTITQDFINNFTDKIVTELEIDAETYLSIYENRSELFVNLEFTELSPDKEIPDHQAALFEYKYRVLVLDNADIFKQVSEEKLTPHDRSRKDYQHPTFHMRLEFIDDTAYRARKKRINIVARGVTMLDMLRYAVTKFGFAQAVIEQPDNQEVYTNFVIPPDYGVTDIMSFFQNAPGMGVYSNGFCSYITQGCWYIYPRFKNPICKRVVQIYSMGGNNYEGLNRYNWNEVIDDGKDVTTHILLNGEVSERNWSALGTENRVNTANIQLAHLVVDNSRTVKQDGLFEMTPVVYNHSCVPTDPVTADEPVNIEFRHSHSNVFSIESELCAFQQTTLSFLWKSAQPFIFHPGTMVKFSYDHRNGYLTMTGKAEKVEYTFRMEETRRLYPMFIGTAKVTIACDNAISQKDGCY